MKAVLMAGGSGTRLRPLTCDMPKPMVPIVNQPIIGHIVQLLKKHHFRDIYVTLYYLPQYIQSYLRNGEDFQVNIAYALEEERPLGTAGCVKNIQHELDETFLVISGDSLTDFDLSEAVAFHKRNGAAATIVLTRVENPLDYGVVITDEAGRIQRFLEKPTSSEVFSDTINTGIYVLEPEVLDLLPVNAEKDFSKDLFPLLLQRNMPIFGYIAQGYWCDIGNLTTYRQAHYDVLNRLVQVEIPYQERHEGVWIGENVVIEDSVILEAPLIIGNNCYIGRNVRISPNTVLGDNIVVSKNSTLKRPIVWNGCYIDHSVSLRACTLGKNVTVHREAQILEGVVVGDDCRIGEMSLLKPEIRIWPNKNVEASAIVRESIIWGSGAVQSLFGELGISGTVNTDITPELVVKIGAAYGATIGTGKSISLSRDQAAASRIFSRAFASGVLSVGVHVQNLEATALPVARSQLPALRVEGGVHIRMAPDESLEKISIEFLDTSGLNISPQSEKKIESTYYKEDFRRARIEELGNLTYPSRVLEMYQNGFLKQLTHFSLQRPLKIVIDYMFQLSNVILPSLLGRLDMETVVLNAHVETSPREKDKEMMLAQTSDVVQALKADYGIQIDANGERVTVIDDRATILDPHRFLAAFVQLLLKKYPGKSIALPVMAPTLVEEIVKDTGGQVIWAKASTRSLMVCAQQPDVILAGYGGKFIFPQFHGGFDGMLTTALLACILSEANLKLSEVMDAIPEIHFYHDMLACPSIYKGTLMRVMIEKYHQHDISLTDGVKIFDAKGWTLILPDPVAPKVHIYVNSETDKDCQENLRKYKEMLAKMINSDFSG